MVLICDCAKSEIQMSLNTRQPVSLSSGTCKKNAPTTHVSGPLSKART